MTSYRISYPGTVDSTQITAALRGLLAACGRSPGFQSARRFICLEVWATRSGINHLMTVPLGSAAIAAVTSSIPGVRAEFAERSTDRFHGSSVGYKLLGPTPGHLRTDITDDLATALLGSLSTLRGDETIVVQWLFAPLIRSRSWLPQQELDKVERAKRSDTELVASGRVAAWAGTPKRAASQSSRIVRALRQASGPDGALRARRSPRAVQAVVAMRPPLMVWPSHLNVSELAGLVGWPTGPTPIRGLSRGVARLLPLSPGASTSGPSVGTTTFPGTSSRIRLDPAGRLRHLHVIGPTGVGKTTLLTHLIAADIQAGRGLVVFDPLGDLTDLVCGLVPENRRGDVVVVDPTDAKKPVGLNILDAGDRHRSADFLVGVMARLFASSWGPRTADILRAAVLTLSATRGSTLADLPDLLTNPAQRRRYLAAVMDDRVMAGFWTWYEALSEAERSSVIAPVLNKVRAVLLRPEALRVLCHPEGQLDLAEVFTKRRIVIIRLAKGSVGEDTAALIGGLLLARLWLTILGRIAIDAKRRHPVFIYLDEFQDYLRLPIGLDDMLAQARGLGVGLTVAHQHLGQLPDAVRRAVLSNVGSRVVFQTTADDARILARDFEPHLSASDLRGLASREIAVRVATADRVLSPVTGRTEPPASSISDPQVVREAVRSRFGRPMPPRDAPHHGSEPVGRKPRRGEP